MKLTRANKVKLVAIPAIALAAGLSLAACGSSGGSGGSSNGSSASGQTCWTTSTGVVTETVENLPASDTPPCTALAYVPANEGGPQTVSPAMPSGLGTSECTVKFPTITWQVWATDSSDNALMFCNQLQSEPGQSS